ncbi:MAG: type II secretion system ATPase GspE [Planctomycetota bacterium]|jgi:general secretion pathway protein E/type IV pilus assembly protein PilB
MDAEAEVRKDETAPAPAEKGRGSRPGKPRLGEILVSRGAVRPEDVEAALDAQKKTFERIGAALVRFGATTEQEVLQALETQTGVPYEDLSGVNPDGALFKEIPAGLVHTHQVVPLRQEGDAVVVAVSDPLNLAALDELRLVMGAPVKAVSARERDILRIIRDRFGVGADTVDRMLQDETGAGSLEVVKEEEERISDLELVEDAALIRLVNQIILEALDERASDIHIEPYEDGFRVRYRIDGVLHTQPMPPRIRKFQSAIISRLKIMANLNIAERRLPQDGRIRLKVGAREVDVRVSVIPMLLGEGIVLRLLDRSSIAYGLEELGMASDTLHTFQRVISEPYGIFLVTGPTGSGKTTTLYAALNKINKDADKIVTVEDPVEYQLPGINQIQVRPKIGLTFAHGLRSILRHDPDIIMIGEIRDLETAEIAVQAALTGHLVFSTLHTNDAPQAITRLVDMGVEPFLISSTVEGLMAQRLVRVLCPRCKEVYEPTDKDRESLLEITPPEAKPVDRLYRGRGCDFCRYTGFRGRTGLFEMFRVDDRIKSTIVKQPTSQAIRNMALEGGMRPLRQDGWRFVTEGVTTFEEVIRVAKADEQTVLQE